MAGRLVHFEMPAQDTTRARKFYGSLFGWKFKPFEGPMEYHEIEVKDPPGGGIYPSQRGERGPVIYFDTDDIDATIRWVRDLGGKAGEKQPIPTLGWFSQCQDTEGNSFSLFKDDPSVKAGAPEKETAARS